MFLPPKRIESVNRHSKEEWISAIFEICWYAFIVVFIVAFWIL